MQEDLNEALQWTRKAAAQGHAEAQDIIKAIEDALRASAAAKPAASSPRTCAHCGAAETAGGSVALKPCSRCKAVVYCGRECQAAHWKAGGHRAVCTGAPSGPDQTEVRSGSDPVSQAQSEVQVRSVFLDLRKSEVQVRSVFLDLRSGKPDLD